MKPGKSDLALSVGFAVVAVLTASAALYDAGAARAGSPYPYERVFAVTAEEFAVQRYLVAGACLAVLTLPALLLFDERRRGVWRRVVVGVASVWIAAVAFFLLV